MHHFAGRPPGARGACFSWYHSSIIFLFGSQGPVEKGGEEGGGVPAVPPLWPLMAPSNERRHSHTDMLTPRRAPFFPFLLPFALCSPLFLPSVNTSLALGNVFVSSSSVFLSPSCFICFRIPHLQSPTHPSLLLSGTQHSLRKKKPQQPLNRRFYWSV